MSEITYNVYRDGEKVAEELTENSYTDTGLEPGTTYEYQVSAENDAGESNLSEKVSVTTEEPEPEPEPEPDEPEGLEVAGSTEDTVDLKWNK